MSVYFCLYLQYSQQRILLPLFSVPVHEDEFAIGGIKIVLKREVAVVIVVCGSIMTELVHPGEDPLELLLENTSPSVGCFAQYLDPLEEYDPSEQRRQGIGAKEGKNGGTYTGGNEEIQRHQQGKVKERLTTITTITIITRVFGGTSGELEDAEAKKGAEDPNTLDNERVNDQLQDIMGLRVLEKSVQFTPALTAANKETRRAENQHIQPTKKQKRNHIPQKVVITVVKVTHIIPIRKREVPSK